MYTQPSYQGRLQRPDLAGQTVMTNYGPHVMQGASQGGVPFRQAQTPAQMPITRALPREDWGNAEDQMIQARIGFGTHPMNDVYVRNVRQAWQDNNNPQLMGGIGEVDANGVRYRIPNALLQQMMFTDSYNQGRSNYVQDFFAPNNAPQGMPYMNTDVSQQRFERLIRDNPQWTNPEALNPYQAAKDRVEAADANLRTLRNSGPMTEVRSASGEYMGGDYQIRQQKIADEQKKREQAQMDLNRQNHYRGGQQASDSLRAQKLAFGEGVRPTYSNLQIKETLI